MTTKIDDGGPAFPFDYELSEGCRATHNGMSLRDYFAAQALVGYVMTMPRDDLSTYHDLADKCFMAADAMLKARAR